MMLSKRSGGGSSSGTSAISLVTRSLFQILATGAVMQMTPRRCCGKLVEFSVEEVERRLVEAFAVHGGHLSARAYSSNSASLFLQALQGVAHAALHGVFRGVRDLRDVRERHPAELSQQKYFTLIIG